MNIIHLHVVKRKPGELHYDFSNRIYNGAEKLVRDIFSGDYNRLLPSEYEQWLIENGVVYNVIAQDSDICVVVQDDDDAIAFRLKFGL